jgi:hypothetical protein
LLIGVANHLASLSYSKKHVAEMVCLGSFVIKCDGYLASMDLQMSNLCDNRGSCMIGSMCKR